MRNYLSGKYLSKNVHDIFKCLENNYLKILFKTIIFCLSKRFKINTIQENNVQNVFSKHLNIFNSIV